jgi:uroporphyrinogen decarboxylase
MLPLSKQSKNDRIIRALHRQVVDSTPIWIMRQAGRYLPEYRAIRQQAGSFMELCQTPELACEVTLQPLQRFDLDAAIIFSDILTIPDAMGLGLNFIESKGPVLASPVRDEKHIIQLAIPNKEELAYVYRAIQLVHAELAGRLPIIGFCGSPWTIALYMIEGASVKGFPTALKMQHERPDLFHNLLNKLSNSVSMHLKNQIEAGASVVMLFDTWGGLLDTSDYHSFSLRYLKQIIADLRSDQNYNVKNTPIILFTKNGARWLEDMADSGCDALGLDWGISMQEARSRVGGRVALQGNMDPACLLTNESNIRKEAARILELYGEGGGHIFNLGHGITPDVPPDHVAVLVDAVHEFSRKQLTANK